MQFAGVAITEQVRPAASQPADRGFHEQVVDVDRHNPLSHSRRPGPPLPARRPAEKAQRVRSKASRISIFSLSELVNGPLLRVARLWAGPSKPAGGAVKVDFGKRSAVHRPGLTVVRRVGGLLSVSREFCVRLPGV